MPVPSDKLTAHFTWGELGFDRSGALAPYQYWSNIRRTADYLEVVRAELGVPLAASGWRSPERNEAVGGSDTSSHLTGEAGDIVPQGMGQLTAYNRLKTAGKAGRLPVFDQIIYYPFQHVHIGLGPRARREFRIRVAEGRFALDTTLPVPTVPPTTPSAVVVLAVALVAAVIIVAVSA